MSGPADWDDRYRERPLLWSEGPNRFVERWVSDLPSGTALDVACGEGRNAVWLAERGWTVTGVDFSPVALERAREMADRQGADVAWVEADVTSWTPEETFDLVLVVYLHLPPHVIEPLMERCVGWVAPGGRLFAVAHDRASSGVSGPSDPELLWTPETASRLVHPLRVEGARRVDRITDDGPVAIDTLIMARRESEGG